MGGMMGGMGAMGAMGGMGGMGGAMGMTAEQMQLLLAQQGTAAAGSRVVQLLNMVAPSELVEDEEFAEIGEKCCFLS